MEITVHKFEENKLSGFTLSTEFFFFDNVSFSLPNYLSSWTKFPYSQKPRDTRSTVHERGPPYL